MEEKHFTRLMEMIEFYKSPSETLDKWAKLVAGCIKHRDIIVVCKSQSGANDEEFETGVKGLLMSLICVCFAQGRY